jgi:hypothetical protein
MKMGTIALPWRYDGIRHCAIGSTIARPAELRATLDQLAYHVVKGNQKPRPFGERRTARAGLQSCFHGLA